VRRPPGSNALVAYAGAGHATKRSRASRPRWSGPGRGA